MEFRLNLDSTHAQPRRYLVIWLAHISCHYAWSAWHTELAPVVLVAVKTEFSYVIFRHHNIGYIPIWITSCHLLIV